MFSTEGYTPLSELHRQFWEMEGCADIDVIGAFREIKTIFAISRSGSVMKIDRHVMALHGTTYAFVDSGTWTISFDRLRRLKWNEMHVSGGSSYPGTPDYTLEELVWKMKESHLHNRLPDSVPDNVAETLSDFEGYSLCVTDKEAVAILTNFQANRSTSPPPHRPRKQEKTAALIAEHWPDGNHPGWKRIARVLAEEHGFEVGRTTIYAALKIAKKNIGSSS